MSRPETSRMARRWNRFARHDSYGAIVTRKEAWSTEHFFLLTAARETAS